MHVPTQKDFAVCNWKSSLGHKIITAPSCKENCVPTIWKAQTNFFRGDLCTECYFAQAEELKMTLRGLQVALGWSSCPLLSRHRVPSWKTQRVLALVSALLNPPSWLGHPPSKAHHSQVKRGNWQHHVSRGRTCHTPLRLTVGCIVLEECRSQAMCHFHLAEKLRKLRKSPKWTIYIQCRSCKKGSNERFL